ncbi:hypothetical protein DV738_g5664, partial [Chaetothyriales sp. CBS 135597]
MSAETTAQKCVHKGCGKVFTDPEEPCVYHPGPPEFHEGQKGWKCCKPRVLTFDEFLVIPPCTTGRHSTVDDTPREEKPRLNEQDLPKERQDNAAVPVTKPIATSIGGLASALSISGLGGASGRSTTPTTPHVEEDSDEEGIEIPAGATCKRRKCGKSYDPKLSRSEEKCVYHPGHPIFHEGSKGWTCCKRKVLEFEEFMKIQGCKERPGHCYVGKKQNQKADKLGPGGKANDGEEELLDEVRSDYYQTSASVIVSYFLKKIDKDHATVVFTTKSARLDLPTTDGKRFKKEIEWWGDIDPTKSQFKVLGTKLEMTLAKAGDVLSWPVLRVGDRETGERIQLGRAGRA